MTDKPKVLHNPIVAAIETIHVRGIISATARVCSHTVKIAELGGLDFDLKPETAAKFFEELVKLAKKYEDDPIPF